MAVTRRTNKPMRVDGMVLAKSSAGRSRPPQKRAGTKRKTKPNASASKSTSGKSTGASTKSSQPLSKLLTPKNMQETIKTVGNLRGMVKNWLNYLQQADRVLDTVFVTTGSLKESGVLDKLLKGRGKNLTTEDFTSILAALMSSPMASSFLGGGDDETTDVQTETSSTATSEPKPTGSSTEGARAPNTQIQQPMQQPMYGQPYQGQPYQGQPYQGQPYSYPPQQNAPYPPNYSALPPGQMPWPNQPQTPNDQKNE